MIKKDILVVGGGSAGIRVAKRLAQGGKQVSLIEKFPQLGGTCVNVGCVPKKILVNASQFRLQHKLAQSHGWKYSQPPQFDWSALLTAKNKELARLNRIYAESLENTGVERLVGTAEFVDTKHLRIGEAIYTAPTIILATGGKPSLPDFPGNELCIDSNDVFSLPDLPKRIFVWGGGYIAIEMACLLQLLGAKVSLVTRSKFLSGYSPELVQKLLDTLEKRGMEILPHTSIQSIKKSAKAKTIHLSNGQTREVDACLLATGRSPRLGNLAIDKAGLKTDSRGFLKVNSGFQTNQANIYALGDVIGKSVSEFGLTPVAIHQANWLAAHLLGISREAYKQPQVPTAIFSTPELASLGDQEQVAGEKYGDIQVYSASIRPLKYTLLLEPERIFLQLIVEKKTDLIRGVQMLGDGASEQIQLFATLLDMGLTKEQLDQTMSLHPSVAEDWLGL